MKIEKCYPGEPIIDLSGPIKLAKFRVDIYSKMEHKIKIRRNLYTSEKPRISQNLYLFSQYGYHERNCKALSDVFFTQFELGHLLIISYFGIIMFQICQIGKQCSY